MKRFFAGLAAILIISAPGVYAQQQQQDEKKPEERVDIWSDKQKIKLSFNLAADKPLGGVGGEASRFVRLHDENGILTDSFLTLGAEYNAVGTPGPSQYQNGRGFVGVVGNIYPENIYGYFVSEVNFDSQTRDGEYQSVVDWSFLKVAAGRIFATKDGKKAVSVEGFVKPQFLWVQKNDLAAGTRQSYMEPSAAPGIGGQMRLGAPGKPGTVTAQAQKAWAIGLGTQSEASFEVQLSRQWALGGGVRQVDLDPKGKFGRPAVKITVPVVRLSWVSQKND